MTLFSRLRWLALAASLFVGQVANSTQSSYVDLSIQGVSLPSEVRAGSFLTVKVTAGGGGCTTYDRMVVTRSTGRIDLQLQELRREVRTPHPCTMELNSIPIRYLDPLYPSGDGPGIGNRVAVTVNGKLAGVVKVVPR